MFTVQGFYFINKINNFTYSKFLPSNESTKTETFFYFFTFQVISNIKAKGQNRSVLFRIRLKRSIKKNHIVYILVCDL